MSSTPHTPYDALRASRLAAELDDAQCRTLAERLTLRELSDGEVLVREDTSDTHLYVIVAGTLAVVRGAGTSEQVQLFTLGHDDTVGEMSFLDDNVHYASFVARGAARVFGLERSSLEALLDSQPHVVYRVMRAIVRRVHQIQHRLAAQSAELENYVYKQHGRY
jgi:CRP/FNR family transcriptional regulator, cyclic AMP receptor protein